jgi:ribosomal protein S18 acetylase RimI-like enzyme
MTTTVEILNKFGRSDLMDLCEAAEAAILDGGGFGWVSPPDRAVMERYWRGVLLVPERVLFVARLDGTICGSVQLVRPSRNNEALAFSCQLVSQFLAPWARGHGLARQLAETLERRALEEGFHMIHLDVRETQTAAIQLYESLGYNRWGVNPNYARIDGKMVAGCYYSKALRTAAG